MRILALALLVAGCGDPKPSKYPSEPVSIQDFTLAAGDKFEVRVYKHEKLSGEYRVSSEGTISFPYLGVVKVIGMSPQQVEQTIKTQLADGYLVDPYVSVLVKEYASKKVTVFGFVQKPGTLSFAEGMTIVEAISQAGGFGARAHQNATRVTRESDGESKNYTIPVESIGQGKADNFYVRPGDVIYVPKKPWL